MPLYLTWRLFYCKNDFWDISKKLKSIFMVPDFITLTDIPCDAYAIRSKAKMIGAKYILLIIVMISTEDYNAHYFT